MDNIFEVLKKMHRREILELNRMKGRIGEEFVKTWYELNGYEVERTGKGHDFRVRKRDIWTGRVVESTLVEVKTGNAKLSPVQKRAKRKRKSSYKVEYVDVPWF
jgi:hypothetical protein